MSLQQPEVETASDDEEGEGVFFIETDSESEWKDEDQIDNRELILQKADALASENRLKEAIDYYTMVMRDGVVRPEQLSTLVDCVLRNFKRNVSEPEEEPGSGEDIHMFDCPSCHSFLGEPVTLSCGHSYCRRCTDHSQLSKCKLCGEPVHWTHAPDQQLKVNVILSGLLDKFFPEDLKTYKTICEIQELTTRRCFKEAVSLASDVIQPGSEVASVEVKGASEEVALVEVKGASEEVGSFEEVSVEVAIAARLCRAEAYTGLKQYRLAMEDTEFCLTARRSAEGFFQKAMVLHAMGQTDESLQVFLQCLAMDDNFTRARSQVEMILCDLLSPAGETVKEGLRATTQSHASPHIRAKTLANATSDADSRGTHNEPEQTGPANPCHLTRAASLRNATEKADEPPESVERAALSRTNSLCGHAAGLAGEGLKRVWSAPQLGDQDRAGLLKRKLSVSGAGPGLRSVGGSKQKRQGGEQSEAPRGQVSSCSPARRSIPQGQPKSSDLECALCIRLFYEPVTTPCGHTFCKSCLERCLDHTPQCPLCKESLKEYLACRKYVVTRVLDDLIRERLGEGHKERSKTNLEETQELSDLTRSVPIFVCTMAYPTVPCPLHVFEPRYRLMIRRCMDTGTRQFGMCISDPTQGFVDHGCMLIIRSVHFLPDGRSVVDTIGGKRFRVLSRGMRDGYSIADIEHLEDTRVEDGEELVRLQRLHDGVYDQAVRWFQNLKVRFHNQILQHFGPMPAREADIQATPNGPACCWWLLAVLPIDPRHQLSVLAMTSLRERLQKIQHILAYLQSVPDN
ncbi:LON peptidase N-terminal domain and ring finger 1, like isoform X2 [Gadus macrocephalus]|uniref:LON peptidase N-terminal domain and ring finger 1, like isoform X2 n=1 Tax=Gadus macrocephalus TaxID=80720 RepID=UPI0028CB5A1E|nr:LON peptidase N-terminal domain and ring finger 1, like isoform X2 [Gadus macrocephalus]